MSVTGVAAIERVLGSIARSIVAQQMRLDSEYLKSLDAFQACLGPLGLTPLAGQFIPVRLTIRDAQVTCRLSFVRSEKPEAEVRILNCVAAGRYSRSRTFETTITLSIQQSPPISE